MEMDKAALFLASSILYSLGFLIILTALIVANNLIDKYWKSFGWKLFPMWISDQPRYTYEHEKIAPNLDNDPLFDQKNTKKDK